LRRKRVAPPIFTGGGKAPSFVRRQTDDTEMPRRVAVS